VSLEIRRLITSRLLGEALIAEGFPLPKECRNVRLLAPIDGVVVLRYDCFVTGDDLAVLARAFTRIAAQEKA
jgi:hypothetical protein